MDENSLLRVDFLLKQIGYIERDLKGKTLEDFSKHDLLVRATAFSILQIGEQMVKLHEIFKEQYPDLPWFKARGMRNIIVHVYHKVDAEQVYSTATDDMSELKNAFLKIKADLTNQ